ncbi:MAG: SCO family protein [Kiloniellales bacterium]
MTRALGLAVLAVLLAAGPGRTAEQTDAQAPAAAGQTPAAGFPVTFGGPFSLVDHRGRPRSDSDFRGRFLLIYFGYTTCPDICPTNLQIMADALDLLDDKADQVQPLFITVDPARDTVQRIQDYIDHFHPRLIGLTGSEAQVRAAAKAYRVHRSKLVLADAAPEDYLVNHSSITFLMGPDGAFVTLFPHDTEAEAMAAAIAKYLD